MLTEARVRAVESCRDAGIDDGRRRKAELGDGDDSVHLRASGLHE